MMNKKFFVVVLSAILVLTMMPTGVMADEVSADEIVLEETMPAAPESAAEIEEPEVTQQPETPAAEMPVAEIPTETPEAEVPATEAPAVETPTEAPVVEIPAAEAPAETPVAEMPVEAPVAEVPETVSEAIIPETVSEDVATATSENTISENITEEINSKAPVASGLPAGYKETLEIADSANFATMAAGDASISSVKYYSQPAFYTNSGYDAVSVYITNSKGEYAYRTFFVTDGSEWLMYDYEEYAAKEFFSQTELKNGKYVPVQKAATRKDNTKTSGIDESKIPTITEEEYDKMVYDWRSLANVPFTRNAAGSLVYAGEGTEEDPVTPAPKPDGSQNQTVITIGDNTYDIRVTKSVLYTGKRHVASGNKATKSQSPDLQINIYRNGVAVSKKNYSLKYANNLNVDGYGKEGVKPYFTVTLKGKGYAKDAKVLAKNKFTFSILPVDIAKANFSAKKIRVSGSGEKVTLGTPTVKLDGVTRKVSPKGTKNPRTGAYTVSYAAGKVTVTGVNNFAGSIIIDLLTAKSMDYNF